MHACRSFMAGRCGLLTVLACGGVYGSMCTCTYMYVRVWGGNVHIETLLTPLSSTACI